jgi:thiosulfate reductase cytochrome b subunit
MRTCRSTTPSNASSTAASSGAGILIVLTGISIWKPVQIRILTTLFGGFDTARLIHFGAMSVIVLFLIVHVVMALLVPASLRAMIRGR